MKEIKIPETEKEINPKADKKDKKQDKVEKEDKQEKESKLKIIKKAWNWVWHSNSILSWIVSLIIAFIIVKFIFFPGLALILHTSLPMVVVESSSMHHPQNFIGMISGNIVPGDSFEQWYNEKGQWYETRNLNKQEMQEWDFKNGFDKGDIIIATGWDKNLEVGDVIIFNANHEYPIIHRIVDITENPQGNIYSTKGDNNQEQLLTEKQIKQELVIGKAIGRIPKIGWIKLIFVKLTDFFK